MTTTEMATIVIVTGLRTEKAARRDAGVAF